MSPSLSEAELTARIFAAFDEDHGGFGDEPKFPFAAPLHLALDLFADARDASFERIVVASLDRMGWGGLYDGVDGGFFRYATTRDWQQPHFEKLLDVNAALLRLYLEAGEKLQIARFTERAADTLRYIQTWLADPVDGGWFGFTTSRRCLLPRRHAGDASGGAARRRWPGRFTPTRMPRWSRRR